MQRYFVLLGLLMSVVMIQIPTTYACSYQYDPLPVAEAIEGKVVMRGTIIENNAENSIIQVDRYFQGDGGRYILLYQLSPMSYRPRVVHNYDYGVCNYPRLAIADEGVQGYFFLNAKPDGIYTIDFFSSDYFLEIESENHEYVVEYVSSNTEDEDPVYAQVTVDEFDAILSDIIGSPSRLPDLTDTYPRFRELYIATESDERYVMPINSDTLILDNVEPEEICEISCLIRSPEGSHYAIPSPTDPNTYAIWHEKYLDTEYWTNTTYDFLNPTADQIMDTDILFSPNGDYIMAWHNTDLTLYNISRIPGEFSGYVPMVVPIWHTSLITDTIFTSSIIAGKGAWSDSSNTIAYWDAEGLKWLDLSTMVIPRLLVEHPSNSPTTISVQNNELLPSILELSTTGQYVRYGTQQEWTTLDIVSNLNFDDVLVTPDEINRVQIQPEEWIGQTIIDAMLEAGTCPQIDDNNNCTLSTVDWSDDCVLPLATCTNSVPIPRGHEIIEAHWQSNINLVIFSCDVEINSLCYGYNYAQDDPYSFLHDVNDITAYSTNDFTYDEYYGMVAWAVDDYTLRLSVSPFSHGIDLSDQLDSPIVSLEWGEPLWYVSP